MKPDPPPVVELAKSLSRKRRDYLELERAWLRLRTIELIDQGWTQPQAVQQASTEWKERK